MSPSVLEIGEKLHVITRRGFQEDLRRHFAGIVTAFSGQLIRVEGYTYVFDPGTLHYNRRPELRIRIFNVGSGDLIIHVIPAALELSDLHYAILDGRLCFTDEVGYRLDINEFGATS
jgi:hypothetical protein